MAIKVSGTTIIDNSRNIQNVGIVTATTFVGNLTGTATGLSGSPNITVTGLNVSGISTFSNRMNTTSINENTNIVAGAINSNTNIDVLTNGSVHLFTTNASATWTPNFRGDGSTTFDSILTTGNTLTITTITAINSTSFYSSAVNIDGSSRTVYWSGGSAPTAAGGSSGYDFYTYSIVKTGSNTFIVFASQGQYA